MYAQIQQERDAYYNRLKAAEKSDLDIAPWLAGFLDRLDRAFDGAEVVLADMFLKARFWEKHAETPINPRLRDINERIEQGVLLT